jgi:FixJ family two-component response regulator
MAEYNPIYWEVQAGNEFLDRVPSTRALWFETEEDREHRYAMEDFFRSVRPFVNDLMTQSLTKRQREVVSLYYGHGKTQEDIAAILDLSQSTVSRHLFGTVRNGKKIGGAIPKLRKVVEKSRVPQISVALNQLQQRLAS